MNLFEGVNEQSGAEFSECGKYRYVLWRIWNDDLPKIMFIGLNPSTANATMDDPTIRRVKRFAKDWGYGGVYMCNLFAYVSPNPKDLMLCGDAIGDNDKWLNEVSKRCKDILFAWGSFSEAYNRSRNFITMFPNALCLGKNGNGTPKHPLYISAFKQPELFLIK